MPIVQAGRPVSAETIRSTAGTLATKIRDSILDGVDFQRQLASWPDADLLLLGLQQDQVNAIKGFFVGDLPAMQTVLSESTWILQLLGVGVGAPSSMPPNPFNAIP
jgi:hypothetical protein